MWNAALADAVTDRGATRRWSVVMGIWSAVALFSVAQIWIARAALGEAPPIVPLLRLELPIWLFWALTSVPVVMLARRFPLDRAHVARSVLIHAPAAVATAVLAVAFQMLWYQAFNPYPIIASASVATWFWQFFRQYFVVGFMIYWAAVGVYHAFSNYHLYRERDLEASHAQSELTEARLLALEAQLRPHFLFNTLNSISALVAEQPAEARRVIAQLADLLRASLRTNAVHVVRLEDELGFVQRYLDIERIRFGERLQVQMRVDPETLHASLPSFILQPLVENALRHGVARHESGTVWLTAERMSDSLVIHVMDDGPGPPTQASPAGNGIGLANTHRRLRELYGAFHSLTLTDRPGGGTDARVEIPWRPFGIGR